MEKDLVAILEDLRKKISKSYLEKQKEKFEKEINGLINEYKNIEVPDGVLGETYESLKSKGKELMKESNIRDPKKVNYYLRYCTAALYDFKGELKHLNTILKSFLLTGMLFFILAPQYFSFLLPLVFVLPVFLGFRGMKKRMLNGLMMGVSVAPMAMLAALIWIRNGLITLTSGTFDTFVNQLAQSYGFSYGFTQNLAVACIGLSVVMLASSIVLVYNTIKHRKMFI